MRSSLEAKRGRVIATRKWQIANPERVAAYNRKSREKNVEKRRESMRHIQLARHGISLSDYEMLLEKQHGRCAICGDTDPGRRIKKGWQANFCIDHCHSTNNIRGLLCIRCNTAIGCMKDNPTIIRAAAEYIELKRLTPAIRITSRPTLRPSEIARRQAVISANAP